tara:strand:+ start:284 stop:523 length:240 start_codon:yes stop_codon:yes gene_type:complete
MTQEIGFRIWLKPERLNQGENNGSLMTSGEVVDHGTPESSYVNAVPIHWDWAYRPVSRVRLSDIERMSPIRCNTEQEPP